METPPEFFSYDAAFSPERCLFDSNNGDQFPIEDLLDFPNDEVDAGLQALMKGSSADSSPVTAADSSCNATFPRLIADIAGSLFSALDHFAGELSVPYDEFAEMEWLSNFVDESFSNYDWHKLQGINARTDDVSTTNLYQLQPETTAMGSKKRPEMPVPAKARSKRPRTAPGNWTSRLRAVTPPSSVSAMTSSSECQTTRKVVKPAAQKKDGHDSSTGGEGRKCLHCATDKTPQWRTGPLGPKTLCNACGVRFKSGRLVPEYRPASSPTFVLSKHSNSHRKVLELRRQKEMQQAQSQAAAPPYLPHHHHHHQNVMFDVTSSDDYLIHHQNMGPDFRHMI